MFRIVKESILRNTLIIVQDNVSHCVRVESKLFYIQYLFMIRKQE
jgi:hypothetical protein